MSDVQYEENYPVPEDSTDEVADATASDDAGEIDGTVDAADSGSPDADWGYEGEKRKLTKEVIVGFSAIALLVALGGVMVAKTLFGEGDGQQVAENEGVGDVEDGDKPKPKDLVGGPDATGGPADLKGQFLPPATPGNGEVVGRDGNVLPGPGLDENTEPPPIETVLPGSIGIGPGPSHVASVDPDDLLGPPGNAADGPRDWTPGGDSVSVETGSSRPSGLFDSGPGASDGSRVPGVGSRPQNLDPLPASGLPDPLPSAGDISSYQPPGISPALAGPSGNLTGDRAPDPFDNRPGAGLPDELPIAGVASPDSFRSPSEPAVDTYPESIPGPGFDGQPESGVASNNVEPLPVVGFGPNDVSPSVDDPGFPTDRGYPSPEPVPTGIAGDYRRDTLQDDSIAGPVPSPIGAMPQPGAYDPPTVDSGYRPSTIDPSADNRGFEAPVVSSAPETFSPGINSLDPPPATVGFGPADVGGLPDPFPASSAASSSDQYTVTSGDSFWTISKKVYGTGRYWQKLAKHNQQQVPNPDRIRPGTVLSIPDPAVLGGGAMSPANSSLPIVNTGSVAVENSQSEATRYGSAPLVENAESATHAGIFFNDQGYPMYRVGKQDSLTTIAASHLGRSSRWRQIFHMNRADLQSPEKLQIGMVLKLPADASRAPLIARAALRR